MAVNRKVLIESLAEKLLPNTIRFSSKLISIKKSEQNGTTHPVTLHFVDGTIIKTKMLIGCDGLHSVVAQWLGLGAPIHSGRSAVRGLTKFPEGHNLKKEFVQFVGNDKRGAFLPMNDKEVYWFVIHFSTPKEKEVSANPQLILKEVTENLAKDFPIEYHNLLKNPDYENISWTPLMFRKPWDVLQGKLNDGCVTVVGDAMHAMTPDLGQGGCQALEDAIVLARNIAIACAKGEGNEHEAIDKYVKERKWRVATISIGAYFSGWVQQGGVNQNGLLSSMVRKIRDLMFYTLIFPMLLKVIISYDCGDLPKVEN